MKPKYSYLHLLLLMLVFFLSVSGATAQITFEQRVPDYVYPFNTSQDGTWFAEWSLDTVVSVYRGDFTLYKDIQLPIPQSYFYTYIYFMSDRLFNSDNKLEYLMFYYNEGPGNYYGLLLNEDGEILYDFGVIDDTRYPFITQSPGNSPLMAIPIFDVQTQKSAMDVFTLPGIYLSLKENNHTNRMQYPSPNPANELIEIPYNISGSSDSLLTISNISGALVEKRILDKNQKKLILNVSTFPTGTYIYKYGLESGKFIVR